MKKTFGILAAFALAFALAGSASAGDWRHRPQTQPEPTSADIEAEIEVENDFEANVDNNVTVKSSTGDNYVKGNSGDVFLWTGASTAGSSISQLVNYSQTSIVDDLCGCLYPDVDELDLDADIEVENDFEANVDNDVYVKSETGDNTIKYNGGEFTISKFRAESTSGSSSHGHHSYKKPSSSSHSFSSFSMTKPMGGDVTVFTGESVAISEIGSDVNIVETVIRR